MIWSLWHGGWRPDRAHESGATPIYAVIDNGVLYTYRTGPPLHRGRTGTVVMAQDLLVDQAV